MHSEDSDQNGHMLMLTQVFAGRTGHLVGFVVLSLKCYNATRSRLLYTDQLKKYHIYTYESKVKYLFITVYSPTERASHF